MFLSQVNKFKKVTVFIFSTVAERNRKKNSEPDESFRILVCNIRTQAVLYLFWALVAIKHRGWLVRIGCIILFTFIRLQSISLLKQCEVSH